MKKATLLILTLFATSSFVGCGDPDFERPNEPDNPDFPDLEPDHPDPIVEPPSEPERSIELGGGQCTMDANCAFDEACTQGGRCINITGVRDATAVLEADFGDLPAPVGTGVPYKLPDNARLLLTDLTGDGVALRIDSSLQLDGAGALILVQNDKVGFQITPAAQRTSIRDMRINPQNPSGPNAIVGIDVQAAGVRLDNIKFWQLGTGVRAYSSQGGVELDLNHQQWSRLVFRGVRLYSTDIRGTVNHGVFSGLESVGSAGFYDGSTLGNTYLAPTMEGTNTRSIDYSSPESTHTIVGTYLEGGDPLPHTHSGHDLHIGGNSLSRILGPAERVGGHHGALTFRDPDTGLEVSIPGDGDSPLSWRHPQEGDWWSLRYNRGQFRWGFTHDATGQSPLRWTSGEHPAGPAQLN